MDAPLAPAWHTSHWLGGPPRTLESLRGRVVFLHAFQMLCPGCVSRALPQAGPASLRSSQARRSR